MSGADSEQYTIRPFTDTPENRRQLFAFYGEYYRGKAFFLDEQRFEWQCLKSPLLPPGTNYLYTLHDASGEMLGHDLLLPYQFRIGSELRDTLSNTNLIVSPKLAGKGQGKRLLERHESMGPVCWGIGSTKVALHVLASRGWAQYQEPRLHALFFRPRPCLEFLGITGAKAALASPAFGIFNGIWRSAYKKVRIAPDGAVSMRTPGISCRAISSFLPEWDTIWQEALAEFGIHYIRRADLLNYKYFTRTDVKHHVLLFARSDGTPVGYVVYRRSENTDPKVVLGRIVDIVINPRVPGLATEAVAVAVAQLKAMDVDGIVGLASTTTIKKAFRANGLVVSSARPASILERGFTLTEIGRSHKELWYLTLSDSDLDDYW